MQSMPESIKEQIRKNDPKILHIDLSNRGLNDDDISELQELLQNNEYINSIDLSNNNITSSGCQMLILTNLKKVNLSHCSIGDKGINYLIKGKIEELDVSYCGLTEEGAKLLQEKLSHYKALSISGNPAISSQTLEQIRTKFVKNSKVSSSPIGIDLGLNIHSSHDQYLNNFNTTESTAAPASKLISREEALANKVIQEHNEEISNLTTNEKEQLIIRLSLSLGISVEIKSMPSPMTGYV